MIELLKANAHVSSPLLLASALAACAAWIVWRPRSRAARALLAAVVAGYWFVATPLGARALAGIVGFGYHQLDDPAEAAGVNTVVVLGGGEQSYVVGGTVLAVPSRESALRALEAVRVYRLLGGGTIIATGGRVYPDLQPVPEAELLRRALFDAGVPPADIVVESEARTTREQALRVAEILHARGVRRFVLVTSKTHMRRSMGAFRALGFDPVASTSPLRSEQLPRPWPVVPGSDWLALSDLALYDMAANVYYWWKGWT